MLLTTLVPYFLRKVHLKRKYWLLYHVKNIHFMIGRNKVIIRDQHIIGRHFSAQLQFGLNLMMMIILHQLRVQRRHVLSKVNDNKNKHR